MVYKSMNNAGYNNPVPPWCKGSTTDFGSVCRGSNPWGGAIRLAPGAFRAGQTLKIPLHQPGSSTDINHSMPTAWLLRRISSTDTIEGISIHSTAGIDLMFIKRAGLEKYLAHFLNDPPNLQIEAINAWESARDEHSTLLQGQFQDLVQNKAAVMRLQQALHEKPVSTQVVFLNLLALFEARALLRQCFHFENFFKQLCEQPLEELVQVNACLDLLHIDEMTCIQRVVKRQLQSPEVRNRIKTVLLKRNFPRDSKMQLTVWTYYFSVLLHLSPEDFVDECWQRYQVQIDLRQGERATLHSFHLLNYFHDVHPTLYQDLVATLDVDKLGRVISAAYKHWLGGLKLTKDQVTPPIHEDPTVNQIYSALRGALSAKDLSDCYEKMMAVAQTPRPAAKGGRPFVALDQLHADTHVPTGDTRLNVLERLSEQWGPKNGILLVSHRSGVGKERLICGQLARDLRQQQQRTRLLNDYYFESLPADAFIEDNYSLHKFFYSYLGYQKAHGCIALYLRHIEDVLAWTSSRSLFNQLAKAMHKGEFRLIAGVTYADLERLPEAFKEACHIIEVPEPAPEELEKILTDRLPQIAQEYQVEMDPLLLNVILQHPQRPGLTPNGEPQNSLTVLEGVAAFVRHRAGGAGVTAEDVDAFMQARSSSLNLGGSLRRRIEAANLPPHVLHDAQQKLSTIEENHSSEGIKYREWINLLLNLPWHHCHYPQQGSRQEIYERVCATIRTSYFGNDTLIKKLALKVAAGYKSGKGMYILLDGPPGTGKTLLAKTLAGALGVHFEHVALGGVRDEAEIRGHRITYIGSTPGRILKAMAKARNQHFVMCLDEIEKVETRGSQGDPQAALMELLDPEQNHAFTDTYLGHGFDFSKVIFVATANGTSSIHKPLLNRFEVFEMPGYTDEDKIQIARQFMIPIKLREQGLKAEQVRFGQDSVAEEALLRHIIEGYTWEVGTRDLKRVIENLLIPIRVMHEQTIETGQTFEMDQTYIKEQLGKPAKAPQLAGTPMVGQVNGLAWTAQRGSVLTIQVRMFAAKHQVQFTGNLEKVIGESCQVALTVVRGILAAHPEWLQGAKDTEAVKDPFENQALHVHLPAGAIAKDGPSAGMAITLAILSALIQNPVKGNVFMTGEISLDGSILPIGGLLKKLNAVRRTQFTDASMTGAKKIIILPEANQTEWNDLPQALREHPEFEVHFVSNIGEVLPLVFAKDLG